MANIQPIRIYLEDEELKQLHEYIKQGYIRATKHPTRPLWIYNYTQKTQSEGFWNELTMMCRGLVLDEKGAIIIRCPEKFFNYNEPHAAQINLDNAWISEKLDGYYISIRKDSQYGLIVTSRGSFDNQYVAAAKKILGNKSLVRNDTYFCELCQNFEGDETIIVTKHPEPKLVLWGLRSVGDTWRDLRVWGTGWEISRYYTQKEMRKYLKGEVEGVVAFDPETWERVKIKTDWFIQRHRAISHCSKKHVWEILKDGGHVDDMDFPDELLPQLKKWEKELNDEFEAEWLLITSLRAAYYGYNKKAIALSMDIPNSYKPYLYYLFDNNEARAQEKLWQQLKPKGS